MLRGEGRPGFVGGTNAEMKLLKDVQKLRSQAKALTPEVQRLSELLKNRSRDHACKELDKVESLLHEIDFEFSRLEGGQSSYSILADVVTRVKLKRA